MNVKRFIISTIAVFISVVAIDFIFHGILFESLYFETQELWRPKEEMKMPFMSISQLGFALMFSYIFIKNYENRGLEEGMRFGAYFGLFLAVIQLGKYAYMPVPITLVEGWMLADFIKAFVCGVLLSIAYKN